MDDFGNTDSRKMPGHLFVGAIHLNHETAIRSNPEKQNCSICPRHWYIDADFKCDSCGKEFTWTAREQKAWFEDYFFWVDSQPGHCKKCMMFKALGKEYDASVEIARSHGTTEQKLRIIQIVSELEAASGPLPVKMTQTKNRLQRQIENGQNAMAPDAGADL